MTPPAPPDWWASSPGLSLLARHRRAVALSGAVALALLLAGGLVLSSLSARWGLLVFGSDPRLWVAGEPAALRVEARALGVSDRVALLSATARLTRPGVPPPPPQPLLGASGAHLQGTLTLPDTPGPWTLVVEAEAVSARGARGAALSEGVAHLAPEAAARLGARVSLTASLDVTLLAAPAPLAAPWEDAQAPELLSPRGGEAEGALLSFPAEQRLSFNLPSDLIVAALDAAGAPLPGAVVARDLAARPAEPLAARGAGERRPLSPHGLALLTRTPRAPTVDLDLSYDSPAPAPIAEPIAAPIAEPIAAPITAQERHWPEAHQFALRPQRQRARPGERITLDLHSTVPGERLFVDLWWGARWVGGWVEEARGGRGQVALTVPRLRLPPGHDAPDAPPALLWAQVYKSPYLPGEVRGGAYLLYQAEGVRDEALAAQLTGALRDLVITRRGAGARWPALDAAAWLEPLPLRLALGRVARPKADPALLIDSGASAAQTLARTRQEYQRAFVGLMSALCALLLGGLAWLMRAHHRAVLASLAAHPDGDLRLDPWARARWFLPAAALIACFFAGLALLALTVRW